jgi:hypothetical protein
MYMRSTCTVCVLTGMAIAVVVGQVDTIPAQCVTTGHAQGFPLAPGTSAWSVQGNFKFPGVCSSFVTTVMS